MDADRRLAKALEAANDALQHLSITADFGSLDCTHIDRLLGRVVDLPTEGNQRNSRRNLLVIRQWMISEGPGVVLLEVLGQLYWRLGELNSNQFEKFKAALHQRQPYVNLVKDANAVALVIQRIRYIQRSKADACQDFLSELSDLIGAKALQICSRSPTRSVRSRDSISSQETGPASLIKYFPPSMVPAAGDMENFLIDFYVRGICPGRTVASQTNVYTSLLQVADTCLSTRYAILSLSASYLCEQMPKDKDTYHQAELYYSTQALQALASQISDGHHYTGALATSMLLMHHGLINQDDSLMCWSCHANVLDAIPPEAITHNSDPVMFLHAQLILARTARTSHQLSNTRQHAFETTNWLDSMSPSDSSRISTTLGVSPQLLFLISSITSLPTGPYRLNKLMYAQAQEKQLQDLKQWSSEPDGPEKEILLATAEAFRLAALIYLRCRVYGFTRFHSSILELSDALHTLLLSLQVKGPLYTAIYPVWPFFVAAVTANSDKRDRLYQRVVPIREGDKNTLPPVLRRISGMRTWLANQDAACQRDDGWWDEMLSPKSSTIALSSHLLCLG
ncbi:uncharacterized protein J4E92_007796 [Alternaria infectoria]|uniref:uncharacterized protein n=1 Tax=Alternaria infectoria TaxID=45303 RepID=UPI0022209412|nr:uncharacterized protein J4E92_007796 [Alternaria infectoria]KAI4923045.1 hypothetical protein J4E92_007796 [Alternaria infectoria]